MYQPYRKITIPFTRLFIVRWKPKKTSPIHSHPGIESNMLVLKGELEESIYKHMDERGYYMIDSNIIGPHQCSHINDNKGSHTIKNLSDTYSYSIHYWKEI